MRARLKRWWARPSRVPARPRLALAVVMGAAALLLLASGSGNAQLTKPPFPPGPGGATAPRPPRSTAVLREGATLFAEGCSSCHGMNLQGIPDRGPSLVGVGAGPVDFYLSTGRMPLQSPDDQPERGTPLYGPSQIRALEAYVASFGGPPAPTAHPARGNLALGFHEFALNCAGCHQIVARGGLTVGAEVPNLLQSTPREIAEAVRMGPYLMPRFDATQIDQHELDSIAAYVLWTHHPDNAGGWGIYNIGPIPEGMVAWFLAIGALLIVARLIGERTPT